MKYLILALLVLGNALTAKPVVTGVMQFPKTDRILVTIGNVRLTETSPYTVDADVFSGVYYGSLHSDLLFPLILHELGFTPNDLQRSESGEYKVVTEFYMHAGKKIETGLELSWRDGDTNPKARILCNDKELCLMPADQKLTDKIIEKINTEEIELAPRPDLRVIAHGYRAKNPERDGRFIALIESDKYLPFSGRSTLHLFMGNTYTPLRIISILNPDPAAMKNVGGVRWELSEITVLSGGNRDRAGKQRKLSIRYRNNDPDKITIADGPEKGKQLEEFYPTIKELNDLGLDTTEFRPINLLSPCDIFEKFAK